MANKQVQVGGWIGGREQLEVECGFVQDVVVEAISCLV